MGEGAAAAFVFSTSWGPPARPPPPPTGECRADRQHQRLIQCIGMRRCKALAICWKIGSGAGGCRLAPSLPRTRAARTPPRGAFNLARCDRRYSASPPPVSASASGRGPSLVATPQPQQAPEAAGGICCLGFACTVPRLSWRRMWL